MVSQMFCISLLWSMTSWAGCFVFPATVINRNVGRSSSIPGQVQSLGLLSAFNLTGPRKVLWCSQNTPSYHHLPLLRWHCLTARALAISQEKRASCSCLPSIKLRGSCWSLTNTSQVLFSASIRNLRSSSNLPFNLSS